MKLLLTLLDMVALMAILMSAKQGGMWYAFLTAAIASVWYCVGLVVGTKIERGDW